MKLMLAALFLAVAQGVPFINDRWLPTQYEDFTRIASGLPTDVRGLLMPVLSSVNVDYATPVSAIDPTILLRAVQSSGRSVLDTTLPAQCKDTAIMHLMAGFAHYLTKRIVTEDIRSAMKEFQEVKRIQNLAPASISSNLLNEFPNIQMVPSITNMEIPAIDEIVRLFHTEIIRKLFLVDPSIKFDVVRMGELFDEMHKIVKRSIVLDKPIGYLVSDLMAAISKYSSFLSAIDCHAFPIAFTQVGSTQTTLLRDFVQSDLQSALAKLSLEQTAKAIVQQRLSRTLPEVASVIGKTLVQLKSGKLDVLCNLLFKKQAEQMTKWISIRRLVKQILHTDLPSTLVDWKLPQPLPEQVAKLLVDPLVAVIGDAAVTPMEAEKMVREAIEMQTMDIGGKTFPGYPTRMHELYF